MHREVASDMILLQDLSSSRLFFNPAILGIRDYSNSRKSNIGMHSSLLKAYKAVGNLAGTQPRFMQGRQSYSEKGAFEIFQINCLV